MERRVAWSLAETNFVPDPADNCVPSRKVFQVPLLAEMEQRSSLSIAGQSSKDRTWVERNQSALWHDERSEDAALAPLESMNGILVVHPPRMRDFPCMGCR